MNDIKLLDCTLRDGGYVNDWKFGRQNLVSIFERLVDSGVDIIEIGFLDERRPFDCDRSIMPDTISADKIYGALDRKHAMVVGMIDYGTCGIDHLQRCEDSCLDGIRVIFKKHLMHEAMEFCRQVKQLGYQVFSQLVSVTSYSDEELLELVELVNDVRPYAVSMVDTYGLLHPEDLLHYDQILDEHVCADVRIGFHAHNNFQLAYANALTFCAKEHRHDLIVDGTLYGMGKSAGNAPTELIAMRLNEKYGRQYQIDPMLEATKESLMSIYEKAPWGYKTFFYLSALNKCHPNYVTFFEKKENLSTSKIDELLSRIEPEEKKLLYDRELAEQIYRDYLQEEGADTTSRKALAEELHGRKVLLIGPGKNIQLQAEQVERFIETENPYVISVNYIPEHLAVDSVFTTNVRRYHDMTLDLKTEKNQQVKIIATTNVERRNGTFEFVVNRAPLLETDEKIMDNSFLMLLKLLGSIGIGKVYCAGFDGYSEIEDNYCNPTMEYQFVKQEARHLNAHVKKRLSEIKRNMEIEFLTYSAYNVEEDINSAAI